MIKAALAVYAVGAVMAALGETVTAAIVAGTFSVLNTVLLFLLHRQQKADADDLRTKAQEIKDDAEATKKALTAPRRIIYDQNGNPIGTVLDLHRGGEWDTWLSQHNRRADDPPTDP